MNARTRFLTLIVASAPLVSCVTPPPAMPRDPERTSASSAPPRTSGPVHASPAASRPAPSSAPAARAETTGPLPLTRSSRSPARSVFGDNFGVTGYFGRRWVDDFEPADNHLVLGVEIDAYDEFAPVGFEAGFLYSDDSDNTAGVSTALDLYELYAGVRKTFAIADGRLHPYVSGGLAYINAKIAADSPELNQDDDDTFGVYLRAGVYYRPSGTLRVGLDYRKMMGTHLSGTGGLDVDYDQVTLGLGVSL
jgi:opacity protein-like surface antigen